MATSIASVTTAYNAVRVLPRQMDALLGQTRPLQEIIVVDNGSTDGTRALLAERYPQATVLAMSANLGAAGAWSAGLEYAALQKRHDWVWAFDDDSVPSPGALEGLLAAGESRTNIEANTGMVAGMAVHRESGASYPPLLWHEGFHKPPAALLRQPVWFADLAIASGLLVRRELVESIGLPRADFFMDFFDFEYCLRAGAQGYKIAVVSGVTLSHEVGDARPVRLPGYSALWPNHAPWREYYMSRNLAYVAWWLYPSAGTKRSTVRHMLRHACGSLLFGSEKFACVKKMVQGFWDGRRAQLGIRFLPGSSSVAVMAPVPGVRKQVVEQDAL
jgi:rhamnopyranosyl-N-acetylglucosaminyl-diphospho-decaprenol beta-1,3/1,4-galactofuranosyltransferase